jgi:hypothetical protein
LTGQGAIRLALPFEAQAQPVLRLSGVGAGLLGHLPDLFVDLHGAIEVAHRFLQVDSFLQQLRGGLGLQRGPSAEECAENRDRKPLHRVNCHCRSLSFQICPARLADSNLRLRCYRIVTWTSFFVQYDLLSHIPPGVQWAARGVSMCVR